MQEIRYWDVRHVSGEVTQIEIDNSHIESAATSFFDRAVIRVLGKTGWGVISVDNFRRPRGEEFARLLDSALRLASLTVEKVILSDYPHKMAEVPAIREDPRNIDLGEKTSLLGSIENAARIPGVVSTRANYTERSDNVTFLDSSGNEFSFELCRSGFGVMAVATRNDIMQMGYERRHVLQDFNLRHQQDLGLSAAERAISLLDAGSARGGTMNAILDPELAGVFAHEAVGHASEGDLIQEGNSVLSGRMGELIGSTTITIVDDPSIPEFGFEPVDAEGCEAGRTEIISRGRVAGFLHNRESLAQIGSGHAGHARAMPGEIPLVRMSNTYIENGESKLDEMLEVCRNGILLKGSRGGQVDPGRGIFQFNAEYGYMVEHGECTRMVRDVSLSGEILHTLHSIELCGNDRRMHQGYCGKGGQSVPVSDGAPHMLLMDAMVGGNGHD